MHNVINLILTVIVILLLVVAYVSRPSSNNDFTDILWESSEVILNENLPAPREGAAQFSMITAHFTLLYLDGGSLQRL